MEIFQSDSPDNSLAVHLYSGDAVPVTNLKGGTKSSLVCRITRIEGNRVHFDRPLRCDLRPAWRPQIRSFEPTVSESGVENLCFEFPNAPYENLFTDIDAGAGTRLWRCGGGAALGKHCGARGTFWNIRAARPLAYPPADFGSPSMNLIALETTSPSETKADGKWFEAISPRDIQPQNLHEAQVARRLNQ